MASTILTDHGSEYSMGSKVSMPGGVYSFGILLLEMFTRKRPTENIFNDGLTLHGFIKTALAEKVMEIVEPTLRLEVSTSNFKIYGNGMAKIEECLVSVLRTGVVCSLESPADGDDRGCIKIMSCQGELSS